jgi:hypothetical protein
MSDFSFVRGNLVLAQDARARIDAYLRKVGMTGDKQAHEMLAYQIIAPIKQIADYQEWTQYWFNNREVDLLNPVRVAVDNPAVVGLYTGPNGQVFYSRPGRTVYVSPSYVMVDVGLEVGWDDIAAAGWDMMSQKVMEAGEELARKRDVQGKTVLDAAISATSGHANTVSTSMTKAAVDAVLEEAATAGWTLTQVAINPATFMNMTNWVWSNANHLWMDFDKTSELFDNLAVSNYGGMTWRTFRSVPANTVYFGASPQVMGAYRWRLGGTRTASDVDITKKVDRYTWDEKYGHYLGNPYALWSLTIT